MKYCLIAFLVVTSNILAVVSLREALKFRQRKYAKTRGEITRSVRVFASPMPANNKMLSTYSSLVEYSFVLDGYQV